MVEKAPSLLESILRAIKLPNQAEIKPVKSGDSFGSDQTFSPSHQDLMRGKTQDEIVEGLPPLTFRRPSHAIGGGQGRRYNAFSSEDPDDAA